MIIVMFHCDRWPTQTSSNFSLRCSNRPLWYSYTSWLIWWDIAHSYVDIVRSVKSRGDRLRVTTKKARKSKKKMNTLTHAHTHTHTHTHIHTPATENTTRSTSSYLLGFEVILSDSISKKQKGIIHPTSYICVWFTSHLVVGTVGSFNPSWIEKPSFQNHDILLHGPRRWARDGISKLPGPRISPDSTHTRSRGDTTQRWRRSRHWSQPRR